MSSGPTHHLSSMHAFLKVLILSIPLLSTEAYSPPHPTFASCANPKPLLPRHSLRLFSTKRETPVFKRTCRVCKTSYGPDDNHGRACRHHPGSLRGESRRKGDWEGDAGPKSGNGGELVYSWTCCGGAEPDPGCVFSAHESY